MRSILAGAAIAAMLILGGCDKSGDEEPWSVVQLTNFGSGPVFSPDGSMIAFGGDDGDTLGLWVYTFGEGATELIWGGYTNYDFAWSPGSDQIAFSAAGGETPSLYAVDLAGTVVEISASGRYPHWSPDSLSIVYQNGLGAGIYTVSPLGGVPFPIDAAGYYPNYSPDGEKIAYCTDVGVYTKLYVHYLSSGASGYLLLGGPNFSWSPNSSRIVYDVFDQNGPIMIKATDIVNPYAELLWQGGTDPDYSPSGSIIVFRSLSGFSQGGLFTLPEQGGSAVSVTSNGYNPDFGEDDNTIVYAIEGSGIWLARRNN